MNWKIIEPGKFIDNSNWIEEEEYLINWTEKLDFTKQPLSTIATTFIYLDNERCIAGMLRTNFPLELSKSMSILNKTVFFDTVNIAKNPAILFTEKGVESWLSKAYEYEDAAIYTVVDREPVSFSPIRFSSDTATAKIPNSISVLHDLYEIVVMMREVCVTSVKSILRVGAGSKTGKTKKVHISNDLPTKYVYVKNHPVSGKRKTRRLR